MQKKYFSWKTQCSSTMALGLLFLRIECLCPSMLICIKYAKYLFFTKENTEILVLHADKQILTKK